MHPVAASPLITSTAGCETTAVAMKPPPNATSEYTPAATHTPQLGERTPDRMLSASSSPPNREPGPRWNHRVADVDSSATPATTQPAGTPTASHRGRGTTSAEDDDIPVRFDHDDDVVDTHVSLDVLGPDLVTGGPVVGRDRGLPFEVVDLATIDDDERIRR